MTTKDNAARISQLIQEHEAEIGSQWIDQLDALMVRGTASSKEQLRTHCQQFLAAFAALIASPGTGSYVWPFAPGGTMLSTTSKSPAISRTIAVFAGSETKTRRVLAVAGPVPAGGRLVVAGPVVNASSSPCCASTTVEANTAATQRESRIPPLGCA